MTAFFLLGFFSLISQVILFRELAILFQGQEIALGFGLSAWLLWGGLGSSSKKIPAGIPPSRFFPLILSFLGAAVPGTDILIRLSKLLLPEGSAPGLASSLIWPFILLAVPAWLIGRAFAAGIALQEGKGGRLYFLESVGAVAGGILSIYLLIGRFPSLLVLGVGGAVLSLAAWGIGSFRMPSIPMILFALVGIFSFYSARIDARTRALQWNRYEVLAQRETRYDHLLIGRLKNVAILFQNGVVLAQDPDPASQEELVHWPLLAHPHPRRVLAVGLPTLFSEKEIRKHPVDEASLVEPDNQAVEFLQNFQKGTAKRVISAGGGIPQLSLDVIQSDPRRWIKNHPREYDVIIQSLPDPTNAALNRFFTAEFFREARAALKEGGILAFSVSSSENYLPPDIAMENMSILKAAQTAFSNLEVIPCSKMTVLASDRKINLDPALLAKRIAARKIKNQVITPETIPYYLDPARRQYLWLRATQVGGADANTDLKPVSFALAWRVWISKFASPWFLVGPLAILLASGWAFRKMWALFRRRENAVEQNFLFLIGLGGMALEMTALLLFQSLSGALYWQLGLLSSFFMLGLAAGSGIAAWVKIKIHLRGLLVIALLMGIFALALGWNIQRLYALSNLHLTSVFLIFLFIPGFLVGAAYPLALNGLDGGKAGDLYAADLWGSALGAFLASGFLIPILGYARLFLFTGIFLITALLVISKKGVASPRLTAST